MMNEGRSTKEGFSRGVPFRCWGFEGLRVSWGCNTDRYENIGYDVKQPRNHGIHPIPLSLEALTHASKSPSPDGKVGGPPSAITA